MKGINNMRHGNRNGDQANAAGGTSKFLGIPGAALIVLAFFAWVVALAGKAFKEMFGLSLYILYTFPAA